MILYGVVCLLSSVVVVLMISESDPGSYWQFLYVPAGFLATMAGWQFVSLARGLTRGIYEGSGGVWRFANRLRDAVVLLGSHCLVMLFIAFFALLRWHLHWQM